MVTLKAHILPHPDLQPLGCRGSNLFFFTFWCYCFLCICWFLSSNGLYFLGDDFVYFFFLIGCVCVAMCFLLLLE